MRHDRSAAPSGDEKPSPNGAKVVPLRPDQDHIVRRMAEEREFLPAMLEVVETPPSPTLRYTSLTICALLAVAVTWSCVAKVEMVAVAPGKVVPVGHVKVVQPLETATIRAIHVDDGDHVTAGDLLVELDPTEAQADLASLRYDRSQAALDAAIATFLLAGDPAGAFDAPADIDRVLVARNKAQAAEELRKAQADLAAIDADMAEKRASLVSNEAQIDRAKALLPLLNDRYQTIRGLYEQHISAKPPMLEAEQNLVERQSDLKVALGSADQIAAEVISLAARRAQTTSIFLTGAMDRRTKAEERKAELNGQIAKIEQRARNRRLLAPADGMVQNVNIHTPGAVVTVGDTLMTIVPDGTGIEVEANISNDDIGFVHEGQRVEVKIDAFPFTRYGVVDATLRHLSRDTQQTRIFNPNVSKATDPLHQGTDSIAESLTYSARLSLSKDWMTIDGHSEPIQPGMRVSAEIKTGERRVIVYVLSPILQAVEEAGRER